MLPFGKVPVAGGKPVIAACKMVQPFLRSKNSYITNRHCSFNAFVYFTFTKCDIEVIFTLDPAPYVKMNLVQTCKVSDSWHQGLCRDVPLAYTSDVSE